MQMGYITVVRRFIDDLFVLKMSIYSDTNFLVLHFTGERMIRLSNSHLMWLSFEEN